VRPGTPAFVRFTGDGVSRVLKREPFGDDSITDLLWVEYKAPDFAGHLWNMVNPEEGDVIREVDRQIARLKVELDRKVGGGDYLLSVSADHGRQPLPEELGGWRVNVNELGDDIDARFGEVVQKITPVDIYLHHEALSSKGHTAEDVARFLGTYTLGDNIPESTDGADRVPPGRFAQRLFAGALSAQYIESLNASTIRSFGPGAYLESSLTVTKPSR
jgi:hypothetical protein